MEVPKSSFLSARKFKKANMRLDEVHKDLIMINDQDYSAIFNIEIFHEPFEVNYIENQS